MSDREEGEMSDREQRSRSPSPSYSNEPSPDNHSDKKSPSPGSLRKASKSPSASRSRSRSRSHRRYSRSRSRDRRRREYSRSRSRSPYYNRSRRRSRRSRSGSYGNYHGERRRGGYYRSHSRSPMSARRRHKGSRDDPKTSRCVGVFGLSLYTQERDLREYFSHFGPIDEVQVVYDHQTGRSRGFAFIYFRNLEDAIEAKERAPGEEIDGRKIRVDFSITERAHTPTPGIYLGKPTNRGYRNSRRSPSPYGGYHRRSYYSRSRSRSRSYTPRRYSYY